MMRVAIAGLGKMGSAFAERLLSRGYAVSVWNRTPDKADALVAKGATKAPSVQALVAGAEAIIVMLWGDEAARAVSLGEVISTASDEQIVIETSTLSPSMYETLEHASGRRGVAFLAAPVLGSVNFAQQGTLIAVALEGAGARTL